jgi:Zn finger protein HypA/HybF involved in hydrogenase expression
MLSLDSLLRPVQADDRPTPGKLVKQTNETAKTLESYHTTQISRLRDEKDNLSNLKKELAEKKEKLTSVDRGLNSPSILSSVTDIALLTSRQRIEHEIKSLEERIAKIENNEHLTDYFLNVGSILFSYSDAKERIATGDHPIESKTMKKGRIPSNSVYAYFSNELEAEPVEPNNEIKVESKKASDIKDDIGFKRDKALEAYLSALNPESLQHENTVASSISEDYGTCAICDSEMFLNETFLDCPECGYRDAILIDSEKPSYKDPPREMSYYAYKKINHLNEWLAQFQAKETTEISAAVLEQIRTELRKERITDMSKLKPSKLKEVIKKLKLNRCYDHVAHILNRLNGISAPVLSREVEEKLRFMFKEIQFSFVKHCPAKRSNFLSYSFVLYKFCELLELDDYLPCFPLLKSREKLYMQDKIWQKICEDMGWEFIRTV